MAFNGVWHCMGCSGTGIKNSSSPYNTRRIYGRMYLAAGKSSALMVLYGLLRNWNKENNHGKNLD